MSAADIFVGKVQVVLYVVVGVFLIISIGSYLAENSDHYVETGQNTVKMVENVSPDVIDAAQAACNFEEIVVSAIDTSVINESMLGWSTGQANDILAKWTMTDRIETCEIVLLDELLEETEIHNDWRTKLGIKNALKNQVCTVIECFDKYGAIEYLEKQNENLP